MREVTWPAGLVPRVVDVALAHQTRSLTTSISGYTQATESHTQRWVVSLDFNNLKQGLLPLYRAMIAELRGRANFVKVPIFNRRLQTYIGDVYAQTGVPHSDDTLFSDLAGYDSTFSGQITGTMTGNAQERFVTVTGDASQQINIGTYFNLSDDLYMCTKKIHGMLYVEPSLRRDVAGVTPTLDPFVVARLSDDQSGGHPTERGVISAPSVQFAEVFR